MRRPVVIVQSNPFNESRVATVIVAVVTSNLHLADAPGNVRIAKSESGEHLNLRESGQPIGGATLSQHLARISEE